MRELLSTLRALGNGNRLRMLAALRDGELCVCQLADLVGMGSSTAKHHLDILAKAGLVSLQRRRASRWAYYRLIDNGTPAARSAIEFAMSALAEEPVLQADADRMAEVLNRFPFAACAANAPRPSREWKRVANARAAVASRRS